MSMLIRRCLGVLVALHAFTACYESDSNENTGNGGTSGTNNSGPGGTTTQGQGVTTSTTPGQGGATTTTTTTTTQGQGGAAGAAGSPGTGGDHGLAGAAGGGGAAGATASCEEQCEPCGAGFVYTECDDRCVCEPKDSPDKPVIEDLLACDLDDPCPPSVRYDDPGIATWENGACLLAAFRDRTRGRFQHQTTLADLGTYTTDYTFLLGGEDEVLILRTTTNGAASGNLERTYYPVWSCTLRSYEELDNCVAAGTDVSPTTTGGGQGLCTGTEDWFAECETLQNPACPSE